MNTDTYLNQLNQLKIEHPAHPYKVVVQFRNAKSQVYYAMASSEQRAKLSALYQVKNYSRFKEPVTGFIASPTFPIECNRYWGTYDRISNPCGLSLDARKQSAVN